MIRLPELSLPSGTSDELAALQAIVDSQRNFASSVGEARRLFELRNVRGNRTFDAVKRHLELMCPGTVRCHYCEDSAPDQIEHFRTKTLFPEHAFRWSNYLYACGVCNRCKSDKFAIFRASDGRYMELTRQRGNIRGAAPPSGDPVLIDPRRDEPSEYLQLDVAGTFRLIPCSKDAKSRRRASYTIDVLQLNRDNLTAARRAAYEAYRAILSDYIYHRDGGGDSSTLALSVIGLRQQPHWTVWREMLRHQKSVHILRDLFAAAPESVNW